ncbi:MAG: hypothetical protein EOO61_02720 [Hymenobacter sp.]|nr:MAG: hypothetical protein EOO61_02720 [Hymenobacter sp.]
MRTTTMAGGDGFLDELEAEKERINKLIRKLSSELRAVDRMLFRLKSQNRSNIKGISLNKKNMEKLFYEGIIIEVLGRYKNGLRTAQIYEYLSKAGYDINYNTFRGYIVKLRDDGSILKKDRGYKWVIADKPET